MIKLKKYLRQVDMFGANYEFALIDGETCYKSAFGGASSVIIYSLSIAYATYTISQYFSGQILPKITTQESITEYSFVNYEQSPFYINFLYQDQDIADPFQKNNNILIPLLLTVDIYNITNIQILFPNKSGSSYYSSQIEKIQFDLVINVKSHSSEFKTQRQQLLILARCQNDILKQFSNDSYCASDADINEFLSKTSKMVLNLGVRLQQFKTTDKTIEDVLSQNYFIIDRNFMTYSEVAFQSSNVKVSDGFIIASENEYLVNSNVNIKTQSISTNYFQNYSKTFSIESAYASFLMRLDSTQNNTEVEYILIGSVLAEILSIIEVLFWTSFISQYLNGIWLKQFAVKEILQSYFPQLQNCQFYWSYGGELKIIDGGGQFMESEEDKQLFKKLSIQTQQKQELINIFSNIAKIEMLLEVLLNHHAIEAGELGFTLPKIRRISKTSQTADQRQNSFQMQELDSYRSSKSVKQTLIDFKKFGQNDRLRYQQTHEETKEAI